jgi:SAM-dependent methyltransferase
MIRAPMATLQSASCDEVDDPRARVSREAAAYDDGAVVERHGRWVALVPHVMDGPNSVFGDRRFHELLLERVLGASVLDVGCGTGELSAQVHAMGAREVYGFDISRRRIEEARARCADMPGVTFHHHSADEQIPGRFDVIVGQAILHHLDFRTTLERFVRNNLAPGGQMLFMEPMSHPLTLGFHRFVRSAHTADEWPLTSTDIEWFRQRFGAYVMPVNLFSFPVGILSSFLLSCADNALMRLADRVDRSLQSRRRLLARGRQGIILVDRPG